MAAHVALDPSFSRIIALDAPVQRVATGFQFTEGPVWDSRNDRLVFSDFNGQALWQWRETEGATILDESANRKNGNTFDHQGRLISCEAAARRVVRFEPDGTATVLAIHLDGKRLNAPNDLVVGPDNTVYFTDTPYGLERDEAGNALDRDLPSYGVYRIDPVSSQLILLSPEFDPPNGIAVSNDGRRLFVDDTPHHSIHTLELRSDGTAGPRNLFADTVFEGTVGRPDGMKIDTAGNVYLACNTELGIWVYSPDGKLLGFIGTPEPPANCAFGGDDWSTLFITARTSVYRVPLLVRGQPVGVA